MSTSVNWQKCFLVLGVSLALGAAIWPTAATAADGNVFIGLDLSSSHIGADDPQPGDPPSAIYADENGGGAAGYLGFSFTRTFKMRLYLSAVSHETTNPEVDLRLGGGSLEVMYIFNPDSSFRPYLSGGLGVFRLESQQDAFLYSTDGPGVTFAPGFYVFLGKDFAFNFGLRAEWINWSVATATLTLPNGSQVVTETPVEESGFAAKLLLGASVWF